MHLLERLNKNYKVTVDDKGTQYLGLTLEWDKKIEGYIFLCQGIPPRHSNGLATNRLQKYKINPIRMPPLILGSLCCKLPLHRKVRCVLLV